MPEEFDFAMLPTVDPGDIPQGSGVYFVTDLNGDLVVTGLTVDIRQFWNKFIYMKPSGGLIKNLVLSGEMFLRVKPYDKSFTKDQAKELLKSLKNGNRALP